MIIAIDCDLRKMYGATPDGVFYRWTDPTQFLCDLGALEPDLVLFEVASAKDYADTASGRASSAAAYHKRRWMIYNIAVAAYVNTLCHGLTNRQLLVSPSSKWTRGHPLERRHAIAGADAGQKDLRECQSMLWFYKHHPEDWVELDKYLEAL